MSPSRFRYTQLVVVAARRIKPYNTVARGARTVSEGFPEVVKIIQSVTLGVWLLVRFHKTSLRMKYLTCACTCTCAVFGRFLFTATDSEEMFSNVCCSGGEARVPPPDPDRVCAHARVTTRSALLERWRLDKGMADARRDTPLHCALT